MTAIRKVRFRRGTEALVLLGPVFMFVRVRPFGVHLGWFNRGHVSFGGGWCE